MIMLELGKDQISVVCSSLPRLVLEKPVSKRQVHFLMLEERFKTPSDLFSIILVFNLGFVFFGCDQLLLSILQPPYT